MRKFKFLIILLGVVVLIVDTYMVYHGGSLCPFEGCKIVSETPFSKIWGIPLNYWGIAFFVISMFFLSIESLFFYWISIGMGFSLYMVFLQLAVIGKVCQLCIFVESLVFVLFVISLKEKYFKKSLLFILLGFFITHAFYTFPPYYISSLKNVSIWRGNGDYNLEFFFDPECPACERAFELLKNKKALIKTINFRCTPVHRNSMGKCIKFYKLCGKLKDPWMAFDMIHSGKKSKCFLCYFSFYRELCKRNIDFLVFLNSKAVPTFAVKNEDNIKIFVGYKSLNEWLKESKGEVSSETEEFFAPIGGVCTPKRCN